VTALRIGLVLALAVVAAAVANVVLLGVAAGSNDSVGRLRLQASVPARAATPRPAAPRTAVTPPKAGGEHRDSHEDD
jgi:hypothetical protein